MYSILLQIPGFLHTKYRDSLIHLGALEAIDAKFFAETLAPVEHWQLYRIFGDSVRYLDIETTGLSPIYSEVTMVGIFDRRHSRALVAGKNLTSRNLQMALAGCKLLVTFYGRIFDVPFLSKAFSTVDWNILHFDLCFACRKLCLTGGLKVVERTLGIARQKVEVPM